MFGKYKKTKFLKVSDPPLDMFFFVVLGFPEGFYNTQKAFEKTKENQRKPKKTPNTLGKTNKTKFLKVSDPPLDMVLFFEVFLKVFRKSKQKLLRKSKIPKKTKETQTYFLENQQNTQFLQVADPPLDMFFFVVFGFP